MTNLTSVQKVVLYIEENYAQGIDKKRIEEISHYSYRNIQRVFKKIFKETIQSFQKRLKLENAYKELAFSSTSISTIARNAGYANLQSFSKAFSLNFKKSPKEARKQKADLYPKSIADNLFILAAPKHIYMPKKTVFFKGIKTNYNNDEIAKLWDSMDVLVENTKNAYFGLIIDQVLITTKTKCRFEACIYAPNSTSDLERKVIFGRKYLRYTYKGSYDHLDAYYSLMYQDFLFQRKIQLDNSPIIEHYEINDMNSAEEEKFETHIYVPIK